MTRSIREKSWMGLLIGVLTGFVLPTAHAHAESNFQSSVHFSVQGRDGSFSSSEVKVTRTLKVRVSSVPAIRVAGLGIMIPYSCASYSVSVGDYVRTVVLSVGNNISQECRDNRGNVAPTSVILDFSQQIRKLDVDRVAVKVSHPRYVWSCRAWGAPYCPLSPPYSTHQLSGTLEIDNGPALTPPISNPAQSTFILTVSTGNLDYVTLPDGRICGGPAASDRFGGATCQFQIPAGTTVTLTENEHFDKFWYWFGDTNGNCALGAATCTIVMDQNRYIGAIFH